MLKSATFSMSLFLIGTSYLALCQGTHHDHEHPHPHPHQDASGPMVTQAKLVTGQGEFVFFLG